MKIKAQYGEKLDTGQIKCHLCPLFCTIPEGKAGVCRFRANLSGEFYLTNYGEISEMTVEPIEKKPLLHFHPSKKVVSIGTNGCNMGCTFCQNWEVSQSSYPTRELSHQELIAYIQKTDAIGVCFTYNEPFIWFEYLLDTAKVVKEAGYKVVVNTNGLINPEPLQQVLPWIDAFNLDIKGFSESFHKSVCKAPLAPVLVTAQTLVNAGKHIEISHLIIPDENHEDCLPLGEWILKTLGPTIPIHLNAYYPRYLMTRNSTPQELITEMCLAYKKMGHYYVYPGNILMKHHTVCFKCDTVLIERCFKGKSIPKCKKGICPKCDTYNYIVQN